MEFHAFAATVINALKVYESTKFKKSFILVDDLDFPMLHHAILLAKCLVVAYGIKKISQTATFMLLLANFIKTCIYEMGIVRIFLSVFHFFATTTFMFFFHDETIYPAFNVVVSLIACQYSTFEFFVDSYVVIVFFVHVFQLYGREVDKSVTLISYIYCLDWFTNHVLENGNIGIVHAGLVLYLPVLLLVAFAPFNPQRTEDYFRITMGVTVWQSYRIGRAALRNGAELGLFFDWGQIIDLYSVTSPGGGLKVLKEL